MRKYESKEINDKTSNFFWFSYFAFFVIRKCQRFDYIKVFKYNGYGKIFENMSYFEITGGRKLNGEIGVKGAKNAALKAVAAALLSREKWTIANLPRIEDINRILEMVEDLGVNVNRPARFESRSEWAGEIRGIGEIGGIKLKFKPKTSKKPN